MAPSVRHLHQLVAKNTKLLKAIWKKASRIAQAKFPAATRPTQAQLKPILARNTPRQPVHPVAWLKQSKGRWYTTHSTVNATVRRFTTSASGSSGVSTDALRSAFRTTRVGAAVGQLTGRTPFASSLRPNLTGGTLGRTAGGYGMGPGRVGGARYFSHTPAAQAQVVHNVSQAIRCFLISGKKAQFDGVEPRTGNKRYKAVTALQEEAGRKMSSLPKATPGSYIDFNINPTITAFAPLGSVTGFEKSSSMMEKQTLNTDGLLDVLSVDFSRALKDLAAVLNDLKRLAALGDLPITYRNAVLRIHFPGVDADTVESLCQELGVQRGIVRQDEDFDDFVGTEIALLFPFASSKTASEVEFFTRPVDGRMVKPDPIGWNHMLTPEQESMDSLDELEEFSTQSANGFEDLINEDFELSNPWNSSPSGYESLHTSDVSDGPAPFEFEGRESWRDTTTPLEYQGFEGVWRFMEQCESAGSH